MYVYKKELKVLLYYYELLALDRALLHVLYRIYRSKRVVKIYFVSRPLYEFYKSHIEQVKAVLYLI